MKKIIKTITAIALITTMSLLSLPVSAETTFSDVPETHWASDNIETAVSKDIISGYEDGTFKPENTMSKLEFLYIVGKDLAQAGADYQYVTRGGQGGTDYVNKLNPPEWASFYIGRLYADFIIDENDTEFYNLDEPVTREEIAKVLRRVEVSNEWLDEGRDLLTANGTKYPLNVIGGVYREWLENEYINTKTNAEVESDYKEYTYDVDDLMSRNSELTKREACAKIYVKKVYKITTTEFRDEAIAWFSEYGHEQVLARSSEQPETTPAAASALADWDEIDDEYQVAVASVYDAGIVTGYDDGTFKPDNTVTRAEAVTMLLKAYKHLPKNYAHAKDSAYHD